MPSDEAVSPNRWSVIQQSLGRRLARSLFAEVAERPVQIGERGHSKLYPGLVIAYLAATMVYLLGIAFGTTGAILLLGPWSNLFVVFGGLLLLVLFVLSRPRLGDEPDKLVAREEYPVLYQLSDRIALAVGAAPVDGIGISAEFNANYRTVGWRRSRFVELGAPLLAVLSPQERVAILAHELSHGANGDPLRGQYLLGAVSTVAEWAEAMRPTSIGQSRERVPLGPFAAIIAIPIELALLGVSELLFRGVRGFYLLVLRQSQRAEYLADLLAANVSGSFAMCTALEKTYLSEVVDAAIQEHALNQPDLDIKTKLFGVVNELGDEDLERYRETSRREEWQVDSTHPPTALRVDMLQLQPARPPKDLLSAEEWSLFDEEVVRLVALMRQELVNQKLEAVYG